MWSLWTLQKCTTCQLAPVDLMTICVHNDHMKPVLAGVDADHLGMAEFMAVSSNRFRGFQYLPYEK
jgi:hypothetical protein